MSPTFFVNDTFVAEITPYWKSFDSAKVESMKKAWQAEVNHIPASILHPVSIYNGIVMVAQKHTFELALVNVRMLREVKSAVPIEVWYVE